jgi:hypothetical protein
MTFVVNVIASMVAGLLVILIAGVFSRTARDVLVTVFGRLLHIDVDTVFRNPREAAPDIRQELDRSAEVELLTGRGAELQRETFSSLFEAGSGGRRRRIRILLPQTTAPKTIDWTADREAEVAAFDGAFGSGLLREQIKTTERFLRRYVETGSIELRSFNYPHIGRILLTERSVYFTPYRSDAHGRDSRVIKYRRGGDMYDHFRRLFDKLWIAGTAVTYTQGDHQTSDLSEPDHPAQQRPTLHKCGQPESSEER